MVDEWYHMFENHESDPLHEVDTDTMERDMYLKIRNSIEISSDVPLEYKLPKKSNLTSYSVAAAIIAVLIIFGVGAYNEKLWSVEIAPKKSFAMVSNTGSTIKRVDLSDGSIVWLKPHSSVEYPNTFDESERLLQLSGEAFFVVEKDPNRPFKIISGDVITKVLGTSFNIRAYEESTSVEVEVLTGKVSVSLADIEEKQELHRSVLLTPNQRVKYIKGENEFAKEEPAMNVKTLAIWQTTNISFDNASVREVIKTLNDRFDVKIQAGNKNLLNCIIRADFTNQNLPDILELLSKSIDADYKLEGNTFILEGEGCSI